MHGTQTQQTYVGAVVLIKIPCCISGGNAHFWAGFWDGVCTQIYSITETKLKLTPECCLLHISNYSLSKYKKSIVRHMLNMAKAIVPKHWKTTHVPTVAECLSAVDSLYKKEETVAMASENTEKFHKPWKSWFLFKYSDSFAKMQNG